MEMGRSGRKVENRGPKLLENLEPSPLLSPERMCPDSRLDRRTGRTGRPGCHRPPGRLQTVQRLRLGRALWVPKCSLEPTVEP